MQQKLECPVTQTEWHIRREEDLREEQGGEGGGVWSGVNLLYEVGECVCGGGRCKLLHT